MSNRTIVNKQTSKITLAPLLDAAGNALVLQPKGSKGDEAEITAETAANDIIERVRLAGWVHLRSVNDVPPIIAKEPEVPSEPSAQTVTDKLPVIAAAVSEPEAPKPETPKVEVPIEPPPLPPVTPEETPAPIEPEPVSTTTSTPAKGKNKNK